MTHSSKRPVQYFTPEYLDQCAKLSTEEILVYLENYKLLQTHTSTSSRLISMRVPEPLLEAFKQKAKLDGIAYQTQIKELMAEWVKGSKK